MSREEILDFFYAKVTYSKTKTGWSTPFDGARLRGVKIASDLVDAKSGKVVAEAGTKITPRLAKKLVEGGLKNQLVSMEEMLGQFVAVDYINEESGLVVCEAGDEITEELLNALDENGISKLDTLAVDHINVGPYMRNTLLTDKNRTREEALIDIYRVMRPGEPPTLDTAEAMFKGLFFDSERYDLSAVGRVKMNARLDFETEVGIYIGAGNDLGDRIAIDDADNHVFGYCIFNDWSA